MFQGQSQLLPPKEKRRLNLLTKLERAAFREGYSSIAGLDEAGRGPLAGPVFAAACILPINCLIKGVDDSKKLTPKQRDLLFNALTSDASIAIGVGEVSSQEIDRINILQATKQAMCLAVKNLTRLPDLLFVDALDLSMLSIPCRAFIRGDSLSQSIAAASIIAKVLRDRKMEAYHEEWPEYGFRRHKGYGTEEHRKAIALYGPCPIHRRSFEPVKSQSFLIKKSCLESYSNRP